MANKKLEKKPDEVVKEVKDEVKEDDDRVMVMVPYVEGEDPEVTVIVNYEVTKFKKGVPVKVKPNVAEVLQNSYQQTMLQMKNQEKFKNMGMDL